MSSSIGGKLWQPPKSGHKRGFNPRDWTKKTVRTSRGQLKRWERYDWSREIAALGRLVQMGSVVFLKMYERAGYKSSAGQLGPREGTVLSKRAIVWRRVWRWGLRLKKRDLELVSRSTDTPNNS